jgi:hypothetical protein
MQGATITEKHQIGNAMLTEITVNKQSPIGRTAKVAGGGSGPIMLITAVEIYPQNLRAMGDKLLTKEVKKRPGRSLEEEEITVGGQVISQDSILYFLIGAILPD